nr:DUF4430 domain-containing protein [Actinomycetota bacterium]
MKSRSRALGVVAGCSLALAVPSAALAQPVLSELRVEAGGEALSPPIAYATDTARFRTSTSAPCNGSGRKVTVEGPTALGILDHAQAIDRDLRPIHVSDRFAFGLFVCGIDGFLGSGADRFWLYKVNHVSPEVGADRRKLRTGDRVLWYLVDQASGTNTGQELELFAPPRVRPGRSFGVRVFVRAQNGAATPAAGARIGGQTTDANGRATLTAGRARVLVLRAERGDDIPSAHTGVCVSRRLSRCPKRRGQVMVMRNRSERVTGGSGADVIFA